MSADGAIVRDIAGVPTQHHDRCNSRDGRECDCYMTYWQPLIAALARMEAAEAERDTLAKLLRRRAEECCCGDEGDGTVCVWCIEDRAALAEAGLE